MRRAVALRARGAAVVLDLGCGTGAVSAGMRVPGTRIVGVDSSAAMLRRAVVFGRVDEATMGDIETISLQDDAADVTVVTNVLHLHTEPKRVLERATRATRPGGTLLVSWPVDGLTPARMRRIDRDHGRSYVSIKVADLLRRLAGIAASLGGVRRIRDMHTDASLQSVVNSYSAVAVRETLTVADCQRLLVLDVL
ncbi:class I SAM-dependent methyltransferase [Leucobacter sp. HY1910]